MDPFAIIGVVASTAQLAAYASSACQVVYRLLRQIPQCPNEHKMAAQHLLQVLKQVADLPSVSRDFENFISQLLIEITTLVHRFSTELENQSSLSRFLYHAVTHRAVLSETFRTLVTKREELSLQLLSYISLRMSENNNMGCGQSKALRHGDPSSAATGSQDVSTSQHPAPNVNGSQESGSNPQQAANHFSVRDCLVEDDSVLTNGIPEGAILTGTFSGTVDGTKVMRGSEAANFTVNNDAITKRRADALRAKQTVQLNVQHSLSRK